MTTRARRLAALLVALASPALAAETRYLDDRSTPEAVVRSLYDAVNRGEWTRAFGYLRDTPERPRFADFQRGYQDTASVRVRFGTPAADSGMSQTRWSLPAVIEATNRDGARHVYAGCYTLHLTQPLAQIEPPFRPIEIESGRLRESPAGFDAATGSCTEGAVP